MRIRLSAIAVVFMIVGVLFPAPLLYPEEGGAGSYFLPEGTLSSGEIRELFVDTTVISVTVVRGRRSVSYYSRDGWVCQMRNGIKRYGRWRVKNNGRICLQMENLREKCRIIVKEEGLYKKYIVKKNGRHQHIINYLDFIPGNEFNL